MFLAKGDNIPSTPDDLTGFQNVLLESVDNALLAFGETAREALYQCIQSKYHLRREEIPDHLETFHQALQDLDAGVKIMEKLITRNLCTRLRLNFTERANWTLIDYVNNIKREKHRSVSVG